MNYAKLKFRDRFSNNTVLSGPFNTQHRYSFSLIALSSGINCPFSKNLDILTQEQLARPFGLKTYATPDIVAALTIKNS